MCTRSPPSSSGRGKAARRSRRSCRSPRRSSTARRCTWWTGPAAVQSALFVAQPFPKRSEPGHEAREVLNTLLGGVFTSRLNMNLREDHAYTYGVSSVDIATRDWGAFVVMTQVRTDVTGDALVEALTRCGRRRIRASARPIGKGKSRSRGWTLEAAARRDTGRHGRGRRACRRALRRTALPNDYLQKYPGLLDSATPTTVSVVAQRLDPDRSIVVVVGDKASRFRADHGQGFQIESVDPSLTE